METTPDSRTRQLSTEPPDRCPDCQVTVIAGGGETWCAECGLVVAVYRIDHGPGRYLGEAGTERTGAPLTPARHDRGLSTEMGRIQDGKGKPIPGRRRRRLGRLRREHARARFASKAERNLGHAFVELGRLCGALDLPPSLLTRSSVLYREAQDADLVTGRSIESIAAGSLYAACRERGVIRTTEEFAAVSSASASTIRHAYAVLRAELGIAARPRRTVDFLPRVASAVAVSAAARARAVELAGMASRAGIDNGRNPAGVAAACCYLAAREHGPSKTQAALAEAAGVSPVTVRTRVQELLAIEP